MQIFLSLSGIKNSFLGLKTMDSAVEIRLSNSVSFRTLLSTRLIPEDLVKAEKELNETDECRSKKIEQFRRMVEEETDLRYQTDDASLLRFLRPRKFNCEKALDLLRDHYRYRSINRTIFRLPSSLEKAMRVGIFDYLPHRDQYGRAIFLVKIGRWDTETMPFREFVAVGNILSEWVLDNPVSQINGYVGLWDFGNFSLSRFLTFCHPTNIRLLSRLMQDCFPARFKIAYCVHCPPLAKTSWNLIRPLLKEKFKHRVVIIGSDMDLLHRYLHPSILPQEYGGELPPSDCTDAVEKILQLETRFAQEAKNGYD